MKDFSHIRQNFEKALPEDLYTWNYNIPEENLFEMYDALLPLEIEKDVQVIMDPGTDGCCAAIILAHLIDVKNIKLLSIKEVTKEPELLEGKINIFLDIDTQIISAYLKQEDYINSVIIGHQNSRSLVHPVKMMLIVPDISTAQIVYDILVMVKPYCKSDELALFAISGALSDTLPIKGPILEIYKDLTDKIQTSNKFSKFCGKLISLKGSIRLEEDISPIFNRVSRMTPSTALYAVSLYVNKILRILNVHIYEINADKTFNAALHLPEDCRFVTETNDKVLTLNKYYNDIAKGLEAKRVLDSGVPVYLLSNEDINIHEHRYDILTNCVGVVMSNMMRRYSTPIIVFFKLNDGSYKGMMRDYCKTDLYKYINHARDNLNLITTDIGGHPTAMGFYISSEELFSEFLDYLSDISLQRVSSIIPSEYYNSAMVYIPKDMVRSDICEMMCHYNNLPRRYIPQLVIDVQVPKDILVGVNKIKRDDSTFKLHVKSEQELNKIKGKGIKLIWRFPGKVSISHKNFKI